MLYTSVCNDYINGIDNVVTTPAGGSPGAVTIMLQDDLCVLSKWVALSRMKLNLFKSNVMWFSIKNLTTSLRVLNCSVIFCAEAECNF